MGLGQLSDGPERSAGDDAALERSACRLAHVLLRSHALPQHYADAHGALCACLASRRRRRRSTIAKPCRVTRVAPWIGLRALDRGASTRHTLPRRIASERLLRPRPPRIAGSRASRARSASREGMARWPVGGTRRGPIAATGAARGGDWSGVLMTCTHGTDRRRRPRKRARPRHPGCNSPTSLRGPSAQADAWIERAILPPARLQSPGSAWTPYLPPRSRRSTIRATVARLTTRRRRAPRADGESVTAARLPRRRPTPARLIYADIGRVISTPRLRLSTARRGLRPSAKAWLLARSVRGAVVVPEPRSGLMDDGRSSAGNASVGSSSGSSTSTRRAGPPRDRALRPPDRYASSLEIPIICVPWAEALPLLLVEVARLGRRVVVLERARAGAVHRVNGTRATVSSFLVEKAASSRRPGSASSWWRKGDGGLPFSRLAPSVVRVVLDRGGRPHCLRASASRASRGCGSSTTRASTRSARAPSGVRVNRAAASSSRVSGRCSRRRALTRRPTSSAGPSAVSSCRIDFGSALWRHPRRPRTRITTASTSGKAGTRGASSPSTLFHYAQRERAGLLIELYAQFFSLPSRVPARRPGVSCVRTFGFIPGWSGLTPAPARLTAADPRRRRCGDGSPLTFCGFGAMLRTFQPLARRARRVTRLRRRRSAFRAWTGALARLMASQKLGRAGAQLLRRCADLAELKRGWVAARCRIGMPRATSCASCTGPLSDIPMVYRGASPWSARKRSRAGYAGRLPAFLRTAARAPAGSEQAVQCRRPRMVERMRARTRRKNRQRRSPPTPV